MSGFLPNTGVFDENRVEILASGAKSTIFSKNVSFWRKNVTFFFVNGVAPQLGGLQEQRGS